MDQLTLLRSVREVAALANPTEPLTVSQRAFDEAREAHAGLPRAKRITERLGLPWRDVLVVAHEPRERQNQSLAVRAREPDAAWLTRDGVRAALRGAALRLDAETVTASAYRAQREELMREGQRRWRHGGLLRLPTDEQIIAFAGSWDAALQLAGLTITSERERMDGTRAPSLVDLLARFHAAHGFRPSVRELKGFARGNGIPYPSEREQRFSAAVTAWKHDRQENGLPEPRVMQRVGGRGHKAPDYSRDMGAAQASERRRKEWTRKDCVLAVARYLAQLPARSRSTQRGYADWVATQPKGTTPRLSTVQAHGGWEAVRREAQERQRAGR